MIKTSSVSKPSVSPAVALVTVLLLWLSYTVLQTVFVVGYIGEAGSALLGFAPGLLGLIVLRAAGVSRQACFLVVRKPSRQGVGVLVGIFVLALAVILPVSEWRGWTWRGALIYAPASGISQELFFRSVLLPALLHLGVKGRPNIGLLLHAALFGLWHIGPLFVGAPLWAVMAVMLVPFLSGLGWGWQVTRDRTVVWAMVQHSLIWVIGNQFVVTG
jgi:membrane protease YdiL (CAAX protease family)